MKLGALLTITALGFSAFTSTSHANPNGMNMDKMIPAEQFLNRDTKLSKMRTIDICVGYSALDNEADRKEYIAELDLRSILSSKDHELVPQNRVENSMTSCGMYMVMGKPLAEQTRQIRPMTFKAVHIYPEHYYVTQSGMVMAAYERKEGEMPPSLAVEKPKVEAPPVLHQ